MELNRPNFLVNGDKGREGQKEVFVMSQRNRVFYAHGSRARNNKRTLFMSLANWPLLSSSPLLRYVLANRCQEQLLPRFHLLPLGQSRGGFVGFFSLSSKLMNCSECQRVKSTGKIKKNYYYVTRLHLELGKHWLNPAFHNKGVDSLPAFNHRPNMRIWDDDNDAIAQGMMWLKPPRVK